MGASWTGKTIRQMLTPTKTGYTLAGWRNRSTIEMWDFGNDTVSSSLQDLMWSGASTPTVNVEAEPLTPMWGRGRLSTYRP